MQALLTSQQASALDSLVQQRIGLSADLLMEKAAAQMYRCLVDLYPGLLFIDGRPLIAARWVALCGAGSNGGDALALVRQALFAGLQHAYVLVPEQLSAITRQRLQEAQAAGAIAIPHGDSRCADLLAGANLILDGLSGSGTRAESRYYTGVLTLCALAWHLKPAQTPLVAIDLPSGLAALPLASCEPDCSQAVPDWYRPCQADVTLCVLPAKAELFFPGNRPFAGTIIDIDGVFPADSAQDSPIKLLQPADFPQLVRRPAPDEHKGQRGALAIYAGSTGALGAALLCSRAAQAAGAGTVSLLLRDELYPLLANTSSGLIIRPASAGPGREFAAVLVGPGLGQDDYTRQVLDFAWLGALPLVVDADALRMLGDRPARLAGLAATAVGEVNTILLPHPGEFCQLLHAAGLADVSDLCRKGQTIFNTPEVLLAVARRFNAIVVLKNSVTWLGHPDGRMMVYEGREAALGAGGTGDVLAGFTAALLARGTDAWSAAAAAVLAHGFSGKRVAETSGFLDPDNLIPQASRCFYRGELS